MVKRALGAWVTAVAACAVAIGAASSITAAVAGTSTITTVAGTGVGTVGPGIDGEPAMASPIDHPRGLAVAAGGEVLIAEPFRNTVHDITADGRIVRVAGTGEKGFSGDGGKAVDARLNGVHGVAFMVGGGFVLADTGNHRIRRVWPDGTITTVAGTGVAGYSGDGGPASEARVEAPRGVTSLPDGGFLIPDTGNDRIRRVWPNGTITTVAGSGIRGFSGDGGPALEARFDYPFSVALTGDGGLLIADTGNHRVRRVSGSDGSVTTVAGTGQAGFGGDGGPAVAALIDSPHAVAVVATGGFLIADTQNQRVRRVYPNGIIETIVGTGAAAYSGDGGAAADASLNLPKALAVLPGAAGFLIGDAGNNRVRRVAAQPVAPLTVKIPATVRSRSGAAVVLPVRLSVSARIRLDVLRGSKRVLRVRAARAAGVSRVVFGRTLARGAYRLRLIATASEDRRATTTGKLLISG